MDVICFLHVSLGSNTVQLQDSLGSRHACACSEAGSSRQNVDLAWECTTEEHHSVVCVFWAKGLYEKDIHKEMFPIYIGTCLSHKAVHNWVEKFSQGHSKVADDAWPSHPVETAMEETVQRVEELIWADRRITIGSVTTALECSHGLANSKMHDCLKFWKVCVVGAQRTEGSRKKKWPECVCPCNTSCIMQLEKICLTGLLLGPNHGCIPTNPNQSLNRCLNETETSQFTFNHKV
jgi:hypothetical protein